MTQALSPTLKPLFDKAYVALQELHNNFLTLEHNCLENEDSNLPTQQDSESNLGLSSKKITSKLTFTNLNLVNNIKEIQKNILIGSQAHSALMTALIDEHSDIFINPDMTQYLNHCELLVEDMGDDFDNYPSIVKKALIPQVPNFYATLKNDVDYLDEQRLAAQSKQVRWSIF